MAIAHGGCPRWDATWRQSEPNAEADREEAHDGRLRRYYRLTRDGRGALAEEAELRAATARVVRVRLGLSGAEAAG